MKRKRTWWVAGSVVVVLVLLGGVLASVLARPSGAGGLEKPLPSTVTPDWVRENSLYGVSGRDARNSDFAQLGPSDLALLTFDSKTQWPEQSRLPAGFQPGAVLEAAGDPGLGLGELHRQGITGKGISVAMIDKYILPDHRELTGRIKYTEVFPGAVPDRTPHFHGMATASILAGASVGVAPAAFLYYFAVPDDMNGFKNYLPALEQILALNASLPREQQIRIVSVSASPDSQGAETTDAWLSLVAKARAQGVEVVYSEPRTMASYIAAGVLPGRDRNDRDGYDFAAWVLKNFNGRPNMLGVPASYRATASVAGPDAYVYWGESGQSWAIPYVAGLLTLGLQVNPDASFDQLYQALEETATPNAQGVRMVNPAAYIAAIK